MDKNEPKRSVSGRYVSNKNDVVHSVLRSEIIHVGPGRDLSVSARWPDEIWLSNLSWGSKKGTRQFSTVDCLTTS